MSALSVRVNAVLTSLEKKGSRRVRDDMKNRYGIIAPRAFGVPVGVIQQIARPLGKDHALALALWATGWYEARLLCAWVDDPALVTPAQMDRWAGDFDNWGICDTLCFQLFDKTSGAWGRVAPWSRSKEEFVKRSAFALLASLGVHDKQAGDEKFLKTLPLVERGAYDSRHFVGKGVSWALRVVGRRNAALHAACSTVAKRLAAAPEPEARRIGREALREFGGAVVQRKLAGQKARTGK